MPSSIKTTGFSDVQSLAIIRDADINSNSAFQSIRDILRNSGADPPLQLPTIPNQFSAGMPRVGIFIMPGNSNTGMLEDLFLQTVRDKPAMTCVDPFIVCIRTLEVQPRIISKSKAHAYLAAMREVAKGVGEAALKEYWDFNSTSLDDLKNFLRDL